MVYKSKIAKWNIPALLLLYAFYALLSGYRGISDTVSLRFLWNIADCIPALLIMTVSVSFFETYDRNLLTYYRNVLLYVAVPLFLLSWIFLIRQIGFSVSLTYLKDVMRSFLTASVSEHLGIFYHLLSILLVGPFLSVMLGGEGSSDRSDTQSLHEKRLRTLLMVLCGFFLLFSICVLLNWKLALADFPFLNWCAFALAGYGACHIAFSRKGLLLFYGAGIAALLVSGVEAVVFPGKNWALDSFCFTRLLLCTVLFRIFRDATTFFLYKQAHDHRKESDRDNFRKSLRIPATPDNVSASVQKSESFQYSYALLRILACFFVVAHHFLTAVYGDITKATLPHLIDNLLMCNNALFFMLSGKFALAARGQTDIKKYYTKKLRSILWPLLVISICAWITQNGPVFRPLDFAKNFLSGGSIGYLWFLYSLAGFYLAAPFLKEMLANMNRQEHRLLAMILVLVILLLNLAQLFHMPLSSYSYPFYNYTAYCILGYYLGMEAPGILLPENAFLSQKRKRLMYLMVTAAGLITAFVSSYEALHGLNPSLLDFSLSRILMSAGIFYGVGHFYDLWCKRKPVECETGSAGKPSLARKIIRFVSRYTFSIYLIHDWTLRLTMRLVPLPHDLAWIAVYLVAGCIVTFVLSLVAAVLFDGIILLPFRLVESAGLKRSSQ